MAINRGDKSRKWDPHIERFHNGDDEPSPSDKIQFLMGHLFEEVDTKEREDADEEKDLEIHEDETTTAGKDMSLIIDEEDVDEEMIGYSPEEVPENVRFSFLCLSHPVLPS